MNNYRHVQRFGSNRAGFSVSRNQFPRRRQVKALNPELFVKKAEDIQEQSYDCKNQFTDFALHPQVLKNVLSRNYPCPTPIQDQALPVVLAGKDVIGIANTGTGKTAAFLLPLINKIYLNKSEKVLIIVPTRELAAQVNDEFKLFSQGLTMYSALCIGGLSINQQIADLRRRPSFIIGTPGRLRDLEDHRHLNFPEFRSIVLDEVDRMLDMGFIKDIKAIISHLPASRQTLFFSATMPAEIKALANEFLTNPISVSVTNGPTAANINQDIVRVGNRTKIDVLRDLLVQKEFEKVLIFGRTKWGIEKLGKLLYERGFLVASIHGNKSQNQRQQALNAFKNNHIQILLATDVASRGLDIDNVTHVINFDPPESYDDYVHRIGRTGRAHKSGTALTFVD